MRIEQVVGQNIARLRLRWNLTQEELGQKIRDKTGKSWSRQSVSAAEKGDRAFTVADLMTLCYVFQVDSSALLQLPPLVEQFEIGGRTYRREEIAPISWQSGPTKRGISEVAEGLLELGRRIDDLYDEADAIQDLGRRLAIASGRLRTQENRERLGVQSPEDYWWEES